MKHVKMGVTLAGLCLALVTAVSAIAAANASANPPEWGGCEPAATGHGKYSDPGCTVKAADKKTEGQYEWYTGAAFGWVHEREHKRSGAEELSNEKLGEFYAPIIGSTTFETPAGKKMECETGSIWFELENANTKGVHEVWVHLEGCQSEGYECASNFEGAGEVTNEFEWNEEEGLKGTLGFVSGKGTEHPVVGLSLTAFDSKSEELEKRRLLFANCTGGIGPLWIGGQKKGGNAVISLLAPVNEMVGEGESHTAFTELFSQTGGIQEPAAFAGKKPGGLTGFLENRLEPLGISASVNLKPERGAPAIEIKATP